MSDDTHGGRDPQVENHYLKTSEVLGLLTRGALVKVELGGPCSVLKIQLF